jgi:hypothetical protein
LTKALPSGWEEASLGEICVERVEQSPPDKDVAYIDIGSIDRSSKKIVDAQSYTRDCPDTREAAGQRT